MTTAITVLEGMGQPKTGAATVFGTASATAVLSACIFRGARLCLRTSRP